MRYGRIQELTADEITNFILYKNRPEEGSLNMFVSSVDWNLYALNSDGVLLNLSDPGTGGFIPLAGTIPGSPINGIFEITSETKNASSFGASVSTLLNSGGIAEVVTGFLESTSLSHYANAYTVNHSTGVFGESMYFNMDSTGSYVGCNSGFISGAISAQTDGLHLEYYDSLIGDSGSLYVSSTLQFDGINVFLNLSDNFYVNAPTVFSDTTETKGLIKDVRSGFVGIGATTTIALKNYSPESFCSLYAKLVSNWNAGLNQEVSVLEGGGVTNLSGDLSFGRSIISNTGDTGNIVFTAQANGIDTEQLDIVITNNSGVNMNYVLILEYI